MTTMNSDSESQDSDEGRRFRFEATRKDSAVGLHSRKRTSSPSRRSRCSLEPNDRDRRNVERERQENNKKISRSSSDAKRPYRGGSRYNDGKESKSPCNSSSSNHKESRLSRESPFKSWRKDSRARERGRRYSKQRSRDPSFDDKQGDKYTNKYGVRKRRRDSREPSRERSYQCNKRKPVVTVQVKKIEATRKISRKNDEVKHRERGIERGIEETNINSSERESSNSRASSPFTHTTECKDLNLSDFDIVSDIEEYSPDNSISRQRTEESTATQCHSKIKKRVSKQQYERLLKRQAVKNRRSVEELHKPTANNSGCAPGSDNNNRSALLDSSLDTEVTISTVTQPPATVTDHLSVCRKVETSKCQKYDNDENQSDSDNSQSNRSTYGPILPPNIDNTPGSRCDRRNETQEKFLPRIIGPTLPDQLQQFINGGEAADVQDTFGPALPPHFDQHKSDQESQDESTGLLAFAGSPTERDASVAVNQAQSQMDDDDTMGPLPSDHPALENHLVHRHLELRARRLKAELAACDNEDEKKREEWMIELPLPQTAHLGIGPRKFRIRPAPDFTDRSSWTDTPADKARKRMEKLENKNIDCEPVKSREEDAVNARNETEKSKKRQKSLLELHQKKIEKKKKKEEKEAKKIGKTVERRPFDRDIDLQTNRFDEARKKTMFSKARQLDDRFSRGKI